MIKRRFFFGLVAASIASAGSSRAAETISFDADPAAQDHQDAFEKVLQLAKQTGAAIQITGTVRQTRPFDLHEGAVILGNAPRLYPDWAKTWQVEKPAWPALYSVIQYVKGRHGPTFSGGIRSRIENVIIRRCDKPSASDTLFPQGHAPSHIYVRNCLIQFLDALGINAQSPWGAWQFEDNTVMGCTYGFTGILVDMKIFGNTFVSMGNSVIRVESGGGFNLVSSNRMEWGNGPYVALKKGCRTNSFVNNIFDACGTTAVDLNEASSGQIFADNIFWRNSRTESDLENSCHVSIRKSSGHQFSNNRFLSGRPDQGGGQQTPASVFVLEDCVGYPIVIDRIASDACKGSMIFRLKGVTSQVLELQTLEISNGDEGPTAIAATFLTQFNEALTNDCTFRFSGPGAIDGAIGYCDRIRLEGIAQASLDLKGFMGGFASIDNVTVGRVRYSYRGGRQKAESLPNQDGSDACWPEGQAIVVPTQGEVAADATWTCISPWPNMKWQRLLSDHL